MGFFYGFLLFFRITGRKIKRMIINISLTTIVTRTLVNTNRVLTLVSKREKLFLKEEIHSIKEIKVVQAGENKKNVLKGKVGIYGIGTEVKLLLLNVVYSIGIVVWVAGMAVDTTVKDKIIKVGIKEE